MNRIESTRHREAASMVAVGTGFGILCAVCGAKLIRNVLFGIGQWDVPTLVNTAGVLIIPALLAGFLPAWRAAAIGPASCRPRRPRENGPRWTKNNQGLCP